MASPSALLVLFGLIVRHGCGALIAVLAGPRAVARLTYRRPAPQAPARLGNVRLSCSPCQLDGLPATQEYISQKKGRPCMLVASEASRPEGPRSLYISQRWLPLVLSIRGRWRTQGAACRRPDAILVQQRLAGTRRGLPIPGLINLDTAAAARNGKQLLLPVRTCAKCKCA